MLTNKAVLPSRCTDACCQGNSTGTTTCTGTCYANEQGSPWPRLAVRRQRKLHQRQVPVAHAR